MFVAVYLAQFVSHHISLTLSFFFFCSLLSSEHQPRVRGWLLASVDGQTTGLVPANYVKVLGKRRGRKHAEAERLAALRQENSQTAQPTPASHAHPQPNTTPSFTLGASAAPAPSEELLESVYRETPASASPSLPSNTVLDIPEKIDL